MTKEQTRKEIFDTIKWGTLHPPGTFGGQHAGMPRYGVRLSHEELEFEVACNHFRSQTQNRQFCQTVFELFLDEIGL